MTSKEEEKAMMEEMPEETMEEMTEAEKKYQQGEEKYILQQKVYIGQLSEEGESNT